MLLMYQYLKLCCSAQHQGMGGVGGASKKQESKDKEEDNFERTKVGCVRGGHVNDAHIPVCARVCVSVCVRACTI